jgi:serine/threonine-protein kinase 11
MPVNGQHLATLSMKKLLFLTLRSLHIFHYLVGGICQMRDRGRIRQGGNWVIGKTPVSTTYEERRHITEINQYQLVGPIGDGSSSRVFLTKNTETQQTFAVKRIRMKRLNKVTGRVAGIDREIRVLAKLHHENVVSLHEVIYVQPSQTVYLVLDYADCGNLERLVKSGFDLTPNDARYIFKQVANAVFYLHQNGIVHQDVKPQNILLMRSGRVLLSDFGNAHSLDSAPSGFSSPAYQAPELICPADGEVPAKQDIWSLGVTLYFLTFGKLPFQGNDVYEITKSILGSQLSRPADCSDVLWDLIVRMLTVNPAKRIGIEGVLAHEYVRSAPNHVEAHWTPMDAPPIDATLPVRKVHGTVCANGLELPPSDFPIKRFQAPFPT